MQALFVDIHFAHFRPSQVALVINNPLTAFYLAITLFLELLLDNKLVLGCEHPEFVVLKHHRLYNRVRKLIFKPNVFKLESVKCSHIVLLETILVLVYQIVSVKSHRCKIHVPTISSLIHGQTSAFSRCS